MDISFWTNLNPKLEVTSTRQAYFGEFFARAKYYCPGGAYLREIHSNTWGDPNEFIQFRQNSHRNYRRAGSWAPGREEIQSIEGKQLELIRLSLASESFPVKFRVEEPFLTLYTRNEDDLKALVKKIEWGSRLCDIEVPDNVKVLQDLQNNVIFRKRDIGYKYKIIVRDRHSRDNLSASFINYLDNLGEMVKISRTVRKTLSKNMVFIGSTKKFRRVHY